MKATEAARLSALRSYEILDTPPEFELDELAAVAAGVCQAPVALLSLVDHDRQFFKARFGTALVETPREGSFCSQAIGGAGIFEVSDALSDPRFRGHPMVIGEPHIRFYAGVPLLTPARAAIGTLCVLDSRPRKLEESQRDALERLGRLVVANLERRKLDSARRRAQDALEQEVAARLRAVQARLVRLDLDPLHLFALLQDTEVAAQLVDDAVGALKLAGRMTLRRRPTDLATVCSSLVSALDNFTVTSASDGDCTGAWDQDRLSAALGALFEQALESARGAPLRIQVKGDDQAVTVSIHAPSWRAGGGVSAALRAELARAVIEAHGGSFEVGAGPAGAVAQVQLPKLVSSLEPVALAPAEAK